MVKTARTSRSRVPSVSREFSGAELGDARRTKRLLGIAEAFSAAPDQSLPEIARTEAELEAFYRFFENEAFGLQELVAPHIRATAERIKDHATALVIHDLTEFAFPLVDDLREGCERMGSRQGFVGRVSLGIAADGSRRPLGVLGCETWTKSELPPRANPHQIRKPKRKVYSCGRTEGARWAKFMAESDALVGGPGRLIHIVDAEADGYPLYSRLVETSTRFVIRMSSARVAELVEEAERVNISNLAAQLDAVHEIEAPLSRRRTRAGASGSVPRAPRKAKLAFRAATVVLRRPKKQRWEAVPEALELNVAWVTEVDPPPGEEPIEWILGTQEPIETPADVIRIVDFYRTRWVIEEFFKALKTGCAFERRQLETRGALQKVLAIGLVVAWRILLLRHESRFPASAAINALSRVHIDVLRRTGRIALPEHPTARQALLAVAALGGHIKNNGEPGLIVLARGMERLLERTVGWISARAEM